MPPFCILQELSTRKSQSTLKYCYQLSSKLLSPINLERQNVILVEQIFHKHKVQGSVTLRKLSKSTQIINLRRTDNVCSILQKFQNI